MSSDSSLGQFLTDLGLRVGAAAVVFGLFVGLGYVNRIDLFGLSNVLGSQSAFFAAAFLLVGLVAGGWILFQRHRE
ncbi:hypothetical protein GJR96_14500 [Haloferax sp. MBLA0076]|uniref:Uncharacterized protein n=1 Tax=Haloferax litoreum TaxID=2666140 RepID=A0A6A8GL31_9EURY|nr:MULTISPECIES: hypothetical protein [Haloferax]KAB1194586.1 hypothetical protein Hfx1148_14430 [Haloferax sp. CBA1148]MRX23162.1 hypothetical protein [Haloferax litoreum]